MENGERVWYYAIYGGKLYITECEASERFGRLCFIGVSDKKRRYFAPPAAGGVVRKRMVWLKVRDDNAACELLQRYIMKETCDLDRQYRNKRDRINAAMCCALAPKSHMA